jgi:hypothetical protein
MQTSDFSECLSPSVGPDYELYLESHSGRRQTWVEGRIVDLKNL